MLTLYLIDKMVILMTIRFHEMIKILYETFTHIPKNFLEVSEWLVVNDSLTQIFQRRWLCFIDSICQMFPQKEMKEQ